MKRVLVTGAHGWIGSYCVPILKERGYEVIGNRVNLLQPWSELMDKLMDNQTHLLHLAWVTEHGEYWGSHDNLDWVGASLKLIRRFREAGGNRIVVAGTQAEKGDSLYGISKDCLRRLLGAYCHETGLSYGWARIYNVYGPGEDERRLIPIITRALNSRTTQEWIAKQNFTVKHDYLHVSEVAKRLVDLLDNDAQGVVDIKSGVGRTIPEIVEWVKGWTWEDEG